MKKTDDMRPQPHSDEAEKAVLGACLVGGKPIIESALGWIRDPEAFYMNENKKIWNVLISMYKSSIAIDVVTVSNQHKEMYDVGNAYLITGLYTDVATTANVDSYSKIVWEKHIQRLIGKASYGLYKDSFKR